MVDTFLPAGAHIRESEAFAAAVDRFIRSRPGVTHVSSFIGGGGLRFLLVYTPERQNPAFVQFLVDVDDERKIDTLIAEIQRRLDENYPDANSVAKKFLLGPGSGGRVQAWSRSRHAARACRAGANGHRRRWRGPRRA
jgi:hypothetical protein